MQQDAHATEPEPIVMPASMFKCNACPCCPTDDAYRTGGRKSKDPYGYVPYRCLLLAVEPRDEDHLALLEGETPGLFLPEEHPIAHIPNPMLAAIELVVRSFLPRSRANLSNDQCNVSCTQGDMQPELKHLHLPVRPRTPALTWAYRCCNILAHLWPPQC